MHQIVYQRILVKKNFTGGMPSEPPRKLVATQVVSSKR